MKINGVTIQMLPAASGDCIYLEFPDSDFRMLIDGGYAKTYQKYLKKFLLKLAAEGKRLNLIVVTHIDDDHISGIRALLKENGDSRNPKIIEIDEIWFNSLNQCITSRNAEQGMSFPRCIPKKQRSRKKSILARKNQKIPGRCPCLT